MAFKIPAVPVPLKRNALKMRKSQSYQNLPVTLLSQIEILNTIGKGSFGMVKLCKKNNNKEFIIKELLAPDIADDEDDDGLLQKMFLKEVKLLNSLSHVNVVKFDSIVEPKGQGLVAYLMEYIRFDFNVLNLDLSVSSLKELLSALNKVDFKGYEHFQESLARDISAGLAYLHQREIAHRDLKPENILVSNQHYDSETIHLFWESKPLVAKLSDFGEARANFIQTASLVHTRTNKVARGSPIYMAPEIHTHDGQTTFGLEDFKKTDIWSLSMVFFLLLNPDMKYPYFNDVNNLVKAGVCGMESIMRNIVSKNKLPAHSSKYEVLRKTRWNTVLKTFEVCGSLIPHGRPSAEQILSHLQNSCNPEKTEETESTNSKRANLNTDRNVFKDLLANKMVTYPESQYNFESEGLSFHSQDINVTDGVEIETESEKNDGNIEVVTDSSCDTKRLHRSNAINVSSCDTPEPKSDSTPSRSHTAPLTSEETSIQVVGDESPLTGQRDQVGEDADSKNDGAVSILGDFHQASQDVFFHAASGTQCSTMCLLSLIKAKTKDPSNWTNADVNEILIEGDTLHTKILQEKGWPFNRKDAKLGIDELPSVVSCKFGDSYLKVSTGFLESTYGLCETFEETLLSCLRLHQKQNFIIRMFGKCRAVSRCHNGTFGVFDPHSCDSSGQVVANGTACLMVFRSVTDLVKHMESLLLKDVNEQIDVTPVDVEIMSEEQVTARCSGILGDLSNELTHEVYESSTEVYAEAADETEEVESTAVSNEMSQPSTVDSSLSHEGDNIETDASSSNDERADASCNGKYPVFENRRRGLSVLELVRICSDFNINKEKVCTSIPFPKSNSVFVVSLNDIHEKDLSCDDSGPYEKHSSPTVVVEAIYEREKLNQLNTISRKPLAKENPVLKNENVYIVKRLYSERADRFGRGKMTRIISRVISKNGIEKFAVIQYLGIKNSTSASHGNSKDKKRTYIRTKPSIIEKEKHLLQSEPPKKVIRIIDGEKGGPLGMASASDGPRDRLQCYNLKARMSNKKRSRNTGPVATPNFERLIASMDTGNFIRNVDFSFRSKHNRIYPNTFAMTDNAITSIQSFCSPDSLHKSQLGIDMTYKVGPFYTTCLSFAHPYFVQQRSPQIHPTIFAGMMTSTGRQEHDYMYLANQLKTCGINRLVYGTDGEFALEKGFEGVFPIECIGVKEKNIKLRCFNHVKDDMMNALKKIPESLGRENRIIEDIIGRELNGERCPGLVDLDDKDFPQEYEKQSATWPKKFKDYIESENMRIRPLKDTFLKSMGKRIRVEAGLGNPPNKYDNQRAESINNVLKEAIGNQYVDQSAVHDLIYENVVKPQENEMVKAFYGSGEYRLAESLRDHEVSHHRWRTMTEKQKTNHVNKVLRCFVGEARPERLTTKKLSVQPDDCVGSLGAMPAALIRKIWHEAETLLSHDSVRELQSGNFCIAEKNRAFIVRQDKKSFICTCSDFEKLKLCAHILLVADSKNCLQEFISRHRYNPSDAVNRHNSKGAGEKRAKKPRRGSQNIKKLPILAYKSKTSAYLSLNVDEINLKEKRPFQFCEIWHNDEPFRLTYVTNSTLKSRKELKCATCGNLISRINAVPPFDMVILHRERFMYPQKNSNGRTEWKPSISKMATRTYCLKKKCLLRRHPYFWLGLLNTEDICLTVAHRDLLNEEFGYEV